MKIIVYDDFYRDEMISMVMAARKALGLDPSVRKDRCDVKANYLDKGDLFWLCVGGEKEVLGCLGFSREAGTREAFLHRFYVKAELKRRGIGSALLKTAEDAMRLKGIDAAKVHLGHPPEVWYESYAFYAKHGYTEYAPRYLIKRL